MSFDFQTKVAALLEHGAISPDMVLYHATDGDGRRVVHDTAPGTRAAKHAGEELGRLWPVTAAESLADSNENLCRCAIRPTAVPEALWAAVSHLSFMLRDLQTEAYSPQPVTWAGVVGAKCSRAAYTSLSGVADRAAVIPGGASLAARVSELTSSLADAVGGAQRSDLGRLVMGEVADAVAAVWRDDRAATYFSSQGPMGTGTWLGWTAADLGWNHLPDPRACEEALQAWLRPHVWLLLNTGVDTTLAAGARDLDPSTAPVRGSEQPRYLAKVPVAWALHFRAHHQAAVAPDAGWDIADVHTALRAVGPGVPHEAVAFLDALAAAHS